MKKVTFESLKDSNGNSLFDKFLEKLSDKERAKLIERLIQIENHNIQIAIKLKWVKKIDTNLYEIRSGFGNNIQRVFYFKKVDNHYLITHGFIKKTQKTPIREIKRAKKLRDNYLRGD